MEKYTEEQEKYRKKRPQISKSSRRSDHKHAYEKIIVESFFVGWEWAKRCDICGRIEGNKHFFSRDFLKPTYINSHSISSDMFYSLDELKVRYKDVQIYIREDTSSEGYKLADQ